MKKDFEAENVGTNPIILNVIDCGLLSVSRVKPIKLFLKEDGALDNKPSIAILNIDENNKGYISEISVEMFNEGLADIGYELVKK